MPSERTKTPATPVSGLADEPAPAEEQPGFSDEGHAISDGVSVKQKYRGDIDGLRAVAVGLVILFHAGVTAFSGGFIGVDVFFVISGFLITSLLIDEQRSRGRISLRRFYARRVRRLLPLSAVVLVATALAALLLLPPLDRGTAATDVGSAAGYFANVHYASRALDYMAKAVDESPVLHYWSLSVEEQFYAVWPVLLVLILARRRRAAGSWPSDRRRIVGTLAFLGVGSFVLSATITSSSGPWAYFGLHTRAWELALGGALALSRPLLAKLRGGIPAVVGWIGLVLVFGSAIAINRTTLFPGTAAAVPVVGTGMLLATGAVAGRWGPGRLLSVAPMRYLGRISYGLYLWHWPCLVFARVLSPSSEGAVTPARVIVTAIALSLLLSIVSHHVIEKPIRHAPRLTRNVRVSLVMGVALTLLSASAALALGVAGRERTAPLPVRTGEVPLVMTPAKARADVATSGRCHASTTATEAPADCLFGDVRGTETIALIGDSHANQWFPAFDRMARAQHLKLYVWTKSACSMTLVEHWSPPLRRSYRECAQWQQNVFARVREVRPSMVVLARSQRRQLNMLSGGKLVPLSGVGPVWQKGSDRTFDTLRATVRNIVVLRDTPEPQQDIPACLSAARDRDDCAFARAKGVDLDRVMTQAEKAVAGSGVRFVDPTVWLCPTEGSCPVVDSNGVIIYQDSSHMTKTFSVSLVARLARALLLPLVPGR